MLVKLPCGCIYESIVQADDFWMENMPPDTYREDACGCRRCVKCRTCVGFNMEHPAQNNHNSNLFIVPTAGMYMLTAGYPSGPLTAIPQAELDALRAERDLFREHLEHDLLLFHRINDPDRHNLYLQADIDRLKKIGIELKAGRGGCHGGC